MIGTFFNTGMIIIGSIIGSFLKKGIKTSYQTVVYDSMGLAAMGLGILAIVKNIPSSEYPVLFIVSLVIGGLIGTVLDFDKQFNNITNKYSKSNLGQGLSTAIVLFCLGSLSILGPVNSALHADNTYLFTNATLDLVTSIVLASTFGLGIIFSGLVLFLWQGSIFLLAKQAAFLLTNELVTEISIIGGFLILTTGLSLLNIKDFKTLNYLPALGIPIIWFIVNHFIHLW